MSVPGFSLLRSGSGLLPEALQGSCQSHSRVQGTDKGEASWEPSSQALLFPLSLHCRRCIIVGNGGVLANKSLGSRIDDYDIVIRLNSAPVKGFEKDVGSKTTLRITYPEGAMQRPEQYERDSLFVLAGFKWQDFKWLKYIVYKERVVSSLLLAPLCPQPPSFRASPSHRTRRTKTQS